jgi:hypothetical protein
MIRATAAALGLALACAGGDGGTQPPGETPAERCQAWVDQGLAIDTLTRAGLRARLGPPTDVVAATEPNRHIPDAIDSLFTMHWPGASVMLRTPPSGADLAERVTVRDDRWLRWTDPGIGDAGARVVEVLGPPQERQPGILRYACGAGPVDEPVGFVIVDGVVSEIVFDFYVD